MHYSYLFRNKLMRIHNIPTYYTTLQNLKPNYDLYLR